MAPHLGVAAHESEAAVTGFEFMQTLRLRLQLGGDAAAKLAENPNLIDVSTLNDIDLRMLEESCRIAQRLQQRLALDYRR